MSYISHFLDLIGVIIFGASLNEMFIRDKFGESAFGKQVIAQLAVPDPMVLMVGSFLATTGAGMQSLTGKYSRFIVGCLIWTPGCEGVFCFHSVSAIVEHHSFSGIDRGINRGMLRQLFLKLIRETDAICIKK